MGLTNQNVCGAVTTPPTLARWLAREAVSAWARGRPAEALPGVTVLDPAVGEGALLAAMSDELASRGVTVRAASRFVGIDVRPEAIAAARRVVAARYVVGNALLDSEPADGCADIVIANPPYVSARGVHAAPDGERLVERFGRRVDLYECFLLRSLVWARPGGVVAMLLPQSWTTLASKEPFRRRLLEHSLLLVAQLPRGCFGLSVDPGALVVRVGRPAQRVRCVYAALRDASPDAIGELNLLGDERRSSPGDCYRVDASLYRESPGALVFPPTEVNLALQRRFGRRIARWARRCPKGPPGLIRWRPGRWVPFSHVAYVADVGIHSRNCRHRLFFAERNGRSLARLLQGAHVFPYAVRPDAPRARYHWVDVDYRPQRGVRGIGYGNRPGTRDEYWDFQGDPAIHHRRRRILIRQTSDRLVAALFEQNGDVHYTDNTLFTCWPHEAAQQVGLTYEYVVAYLNSAAVNRIYQFLSQECGVRQAQVKVSNLRRLPFRMPDAEELGQVSELARRAAEELARAGPRDGAEVLSHLDELFDARYAPATILPLVK